MRREGDKGALVVDEHVIQQLLHTSIEFVVGFAVGGGPQFVVLCEVWFECHVREGINERRLGTSFVAGMNTVDFSEIFFDKGLVRCVRGKLEIGESEIGCLKTSVQGACIISLRHGGFGKGDLMFPECVDGLGLLFANIGKMRVDPVGNRVTILLCPVTLLESA